MLQGIVATEVVLGRGDADTDPRTDGCGLDFRPHLLLEPVGCSAADENLLLVEPVEGDRMGETAIDHRTETGKARRGDVRRGDVPTLERATTSIAVRGQRLQPLHRHELTPKRSRRDTTALGLLFSVPLDVPAVRRDDDQTPVLAIVVEALHEFRRRSRQSASEIVGSAAGSTTAPSNACRGADDRATRYGPSGRVLVRRSLTANRSPSGGCGPADRPRRSLRRWSSRA